MGKGSKRKAEERAKNKATVQKREEALPEIPSPRSQNPKVSEMIMEAIRELAERAGSSRPAILKYIKANYFVNDERIGNLLKRNLLSLLEDGHIIHSKPTMMGANGSFKLSKTLRTSSNSLKLIPKTKRSPPRSSKGKSSSKEGPTRSRKISLKDTKDSSRRRKMSKTSSGSHSAGNRRQKTEMKRNRK